MSDEAEPVAGSDSPTATICRYAAGTEYRDIPGEVIEAAKLYLLDNVACAIGGTRLGPSRLVVDLFTELGGVEEATVLGLGARLPAHHAAYVNSYASNALDFDDTFEQGALSHPGSVVVPAALAVSEWIGAGGQEVLQAVVIGYEVSLRIGLALRPTPARLRQVRGFATWQIFGAVAVAANLLRLDIEQTCDAFGLAGTNAPVPFIQKFGDESERRYSWAKNNYGWTSMGALLACRMAQRGFLGNRTILDGERGFWVMAGSDRCDFGVMTAGLGRDYLMPMTGFKPYACCRLVHPALDTVARMHAEYAIDLAGITRIDVYTCSEVASYLGGVRPASVIDAQFCLPYLVALELSSRSPRRGLSERDLTDPAVLALTDRVALHRDAEADRHFFERSLATARVVLTLEDGRRVEEFVEIPTGSPGGGAFTTADVRAKFHALVEPVVGQERALELEAVVQAFERHNAADLVRAAVLKR